MAVNDDTPERDPRLARLMAAAGDEAPPAALDAAILAAARREVSARPHATGGGLADAPLPRARRNWYVPVSIAAVLVLSVSLVTLVHEEKGGELTRPADKVVAPPQANAPAAEAPAPAQVGEPHQAKVSPGAAAPAPEAANEQPATQATGGKPPSTPAAATDGVGKARSEASATPQQSATGAAAPAPEPAPRREITVSPAPPPAPAVAAPKPANPFPAASEAEAPAMAAPAPPSAPAKMMRESSERDRADRAAPRSVLQDAPPAMADAMPRPGIAGNTTAQPAPSDADNRAMAPPSPAVRPAPAPALKSAARPEEKRAPVWNGLENLPAEKWLERMAEFKRDGRNADLEALLGEFRRRFPEHPMSLR